MACTYNRVTNVSISRDRRARDQTANYITRGLLSGFTPLHRLYIAIQTLNRFKARSAGD